MAAEGRMGGMEPETANKARELTARLRREMNGAVAGSMAEKGMVYGLNYGVSLADIRAIARDFAPDHALALHIYPHDVRELRLAAYLVADPATVTCEELPFWGGGITTTELASNAAASLLSKTHVAQDVIFGWLRGGTSSLLMFTAVMTAAANLRATGFRPLWDPGRLMDTILERVREHRGPYSAAYLGEALSALIVRLNAIPGCDPGELKLFIARVGGVNPPLGKYLETNAGWALD
ncbi:MAG: hypothetical protein LUE26_00250 [Alistipes sp.]|nr:hypothetical protein [Alistipes sp.]